MAKILDDFDWNDHHRSGSKYDRFMDGQTWQIGIDEPDFAHLAHIDSARGALAQRAKLLGLTFRSRKFDNKTLVFQVTGRRET